VRRGQIERRVAGRKKKKKKNEGVFSASKFVESCDKDFEAAKLEKNRSREARS